jgi:hypothetical protein
MKALLSVLALSAALLSGTAAAQAVPIPEPDAVTYDRMPANTHDPVRLATTGDIAPQEDEPGWDCATMGNKDCGPFTPEDEGEAITPAELAELAAEPQEDEPGWDCTIHGNKICGGTEVTHPNLQEDDPGWNCYVDGNRVCGPDTAGLETDAWSKFTPTVLPAWIQAQGFKASYMGTMQSDAPYLTDSWHTYHPSSIPGYTHVFNIELTK